MLNLKILDARTRVFEDSDILQLLEEVGSGKEWQIQVRCDNQIRAEAIRHRIFKFAMADGRQFEITILGSGAAVGVKKFMPPAYIWDEKNKRDVPREEWEKTHAS